MRLICPNCEAQYEVVDNAIPAGGRDVQCSNCGNTWYQLPGQAIEMPPKALDLQPSPRPVAEVQPAPAPGIEPEPAPVEIPAPPHVKKEDESAPVARLKAAAGRKATSLSGTGQEPELPQSAAETANVSDVASAVALDSPPASRGFDGPPPLPRRKLEDSVASVLREEAAREHAARQADAAAVLGDTFQKPAAAVPPVSDPVADRIAAVLIEDATLAQRAKGRELLPDIEEIKSTLRSGSDRGAESVDDNDSEDGEGMLQRRRGFRSGFSLMFLLGVLLLLAYVSAPRIIQFAPGSEPYVRAYVEQVNIARFWLDGIMQQASNKLQVDSGQ